jgi:hypothetical protein
MNWTRDPQHGGLSLAAPAEVETWEGLRPYLAAGWAKLLGDLPALDPPIHPPPVITLIIDGRMGGGNIWAALSGGGKLPTAVANQELATSIHLDLPGVEELMIRSVEPEETVCAFAAEFLSAVRLAPAKAAVEAVVKLHPKAVVTHEAIDPEHGWYVPFQVTLANLLKGKLPKIEFMFDFEEG